MGAYMNIQEIKDYIQDELSNGNELPYKKIYSFCVKIYRTLHKDKVRVWNSRYRKKNNTHKSSIGNIPPKTLPVSNGNKRIILTPIAHGDNTPLPVENKNKVGIW